MNSFLASLFLLAAVPLRDSWTVYFQENCLPCRKQLRALSCLESKGWDIRLVGVGQDRVRLRHELSRLTEKTLEFKSLSWSEARAEGINGTPFHVRRYKDGREERFHGLVPCS